MQPNIILTTARLEPLARVRRALQGAEERIPVEKELMQLVAEALRSPARLDPMDRYFLEDLASHKAPPSVDPWDLAQVLYPTLCLGSGADRLSCTYETISGLCSSIPEIEDLFLESHIKQGTPALAVEEVHPPFGQESHVVSDELALDGLRQRFQVACMAHPPEDEHVLAAWRITRYDLQHVLDATRAPGVGLFVYQP